MTLPSRSIGRTGLNVTEFGFGTSAVGNLARPTPPETAEEAIESAWQNGVRYFDTAPHYGLGLAEERLGRALATRDRSDYVLSTKVGRLLVSNESPSGSDLDTGGFAVTDRLRRKLDYSRDGVRRSLDASLERLGVDRIDIVLVHDPDEHVQQTVTEALPALIELREQGVIRAVGVGMNHWQAPLEMLQHCDIDVVMIAGRWTALDRSAGPLLAACLDRDVAVLAASPFNSGLLAHDWPVDGVAFDYAPASAARLAQARALARRCLSHGVTLPDLAMQFPLRHPAVVSVVTGPRTAQHVASSLERLQRPIPEELWSDVLSEV